MTDRQPCIYNGRTNLRGLRALGLSWSRYKRELHGSNGIGTLGNERTGFDSQVRKLDILCSPSKKNKVVEGMLEKSGIPVMNKSL